MAVFMELRNINGMKGCIHGGTRLFEKGYCVVEVLAMSVMTITMMTEELGRKYQCDNLEFELKSVVQSVKTETFGSLNYASPPPASTVSGFANVIAAGSKLNGASSVLWRKESKSKFSSTSLPIKSGLLISYVFCCSNQHQMFYRSQKAQRENSHHHPDRQNQNRAAA